MPTVLFIQGFRFFFYSNENDEPIHIHVEKAHAEGKLWLEPIVKVAYMHGFTPKQQGKIMQIVLVNTVILKEKWNEYFA